MGQSIYFTNDQLNYLDRLVNSFDSVDAEQDGAFDEAKILKELNLKVFQAKQKEKLNK